MEREPGAMERHLMRAVRSLAWNRKMLPMIEERLERAERQVRAYLQIQGQTAVRAGVYNVEIDGDEKIRLTRLQVDDWQQLRLLDGEPAAAILVEDEGGAEMSGSDGYR